MNPPETLWLVRHGESIANVARHMAEAQNLLTIDFSQREPDVPLSELGRQQSIAMGKWFAALPEKDKPARIYISPFARTVESAALLTEIAGLDAGKIVIDERLRERELGIFDRLTREGARQKYPEECARRELLGKYYYRAPGGENWCDVIQRVKSFWRDLREKENSERVLVITHEVVIRCFRCVLEGLNEEQIMAIDRACDIHNGAITEYTFAQKTGGLILSRDNFLPV
jgi:broad specificity phosphatase PhoE